MTQDLHDEIQRAARLAAQESAHTISLRDYVDQRLADMNTAVSLAQVNTTERMEKLNEFRAALSDQSKSFITRPEHEQICARLADLEQNRARLEGRASLGAVVAIVGVVISLVSLLEKYLFK